MVPFATPRNSETYDVMGERAARAALLDAGVEYAQIEQAYVGYVYGDSTCGQAALYGLGQTGIPIVNVNNNCSTGSSALFLARQAVESGAVDCALVLGFEQMQRGALDMLWQDRTSPFARFDNVAHAVQGESDAPFAAQYFGGAGAAYAAEFGLADDTLARISVKARRHAANNPYAVFRDQVTVDEVARLAEDLRPAHTVAVLPTDLWRSSCGALLGRVRSQARVAARCGDRRPGDGHRLPVDLRGSRHAQARRLRHVSIGGAAGV